MVNNKQVAAVTLDITNSSSMSKISEFLSNHNYTVGSVYISNVIDFLLRDNFIHHMKSYYPNDLLGSQRALQLWNNIDSLPTEKGILICQAEETMDNVVYARYRSLHSSNNLQK
jgi:hypothetical protein